MTCTIVFDQLVNGFGKGKDRVNSAPTKCAYLTKTAKASINFFEGKEEKVSDGSEILHLTSESFE